MFVKDALLDTTPKGVCLKIQSSNNIVQETGVQHFLFWKVGIKHLVSLSNTKFMHADICFVVK